MLRSLLYISCHSLLVSCYTPSCVSCSSPPESHATLSTVCFLPFPSGLMLHSIVCFLVVPSRVSCYTLYWVFIWSFSISSLLSFKGKQLYPLFSPSYHYLFLSILLPPLFLETLNTLNPSRHRYKPLLVIPTSSYIPSCSNCLLLLLFIFLLYAKINKVKIYC